MAALLSFLNRKTSPSPPLNVKKEWEDRVQKRIAEEEVERQKVLQKEREDDQKRNADLEMEAERFRKGMLDCVRKQIQTTSDYSFQCRANRPHLHDSYLQTKALILHTQDEIRNELRKNGFNPTENGIKSFSEGTPFGAPYAIVCKVDLR